MTENKIINALLVVAVLINLVLGTLLGSRMFELKGPASPHVAPPENQAQLQHTIQDWIELTSSKLEDAAKNAKQDASAYLPTGEEKDAAIKSANLDSDAFRKVKDKLKSGYQKFNLPFESF